MKDISKYVQIRTNNLKPAKGRVLISEPFMSDYYFGRSVILLAEHNDEGSFGVIVNKRITATFNEILKDFPDFDAPVYLGGPVETGSLFYIHTLGEELEGATEITEGLYWGGDIEALKELILIRTIDPAEIRFFLGYSGWAANQLEGELKRNSWVISNISKDILMKMDPVKMWDRLLEKMGGTYKYWTKFPIDPTMN
ncbi:MAG: YqgE/AlgH family protein [Chlorobi bacterium]|nr:YqgE/AlgH family protein [Chlorobiota bacterium]